jgi:hypothetical protein
VLAFLILPGAPPLSSAPVDIALAFVGQLMMLAIAFRAVWGPMAFYPAQVEMPA